MDPVSSSAGHNSASVETSLGDLLTLAEQRQHDDIASGEHAQRHNKKQAENSTEKALKRKKKQPVEMSSKHPVPVLRNVTKEKRRQLRDPRFDSSYEFSEHLFNRQYSFINDMQKAEKNQLKASLKNVNNAEVKAEIKDYLRRTEDKERTKLAKEKQKDRLRALRKQNEERLKAGKKPIYAKRSQLTKEELKEQFDELKKTGKLEKFLKKKTKAKQKI